MPDLHQIPHLDEIAHHGEYHGVGKRVTETFADRYHHQNKVVPSLEDAIRLTGLRDGMTISFHHHFRNGDHIVNMVLDKLAEMGFHDLSSQLRRFQPFTLRSSATFRTALSRTSKRPVCAASWRRPSPAA